MPHFGSLRSFEQLDALAQRYHCLPSDVLRRSYSEYCIDEACAIAGEAKDARVLEQLEQVPRAPSQTRNRIMGGLMTGPMPVIPDE